jgi:hypothetical protein
MADFSFPTLTTAVVGVTTSVAYKVQATNFTINFTQNQKRDFSLNLGAVTSGWLTGRRPQSGQLYPRGVYNK